MNWIRTLFFLTYIQALMFLISVCWHLKSHGIGATYCLESSLAQPTVAICHGNDFMCSWKTSGNMLSHAVSIVVYNIQIFRGRGSCIQTDLFTMSHKYMIGIRPSRNSQCSPKQFDNKMHYFLFSFNKSSLFRYIGSINDSKWSWSSAT